MSDKIELESGSETPIEVLDDKESEYDRDTLSNGDADEPSSDGHWSLIYQLILSETGLNGVAALSAALLAGILQGALVHIIADNAERLAVSSVDIFDLMIFLGCLLGLGVALILNMRLSTKVGDRIVTGISLRLAYFLRSAPLATLESVGSDRVLTAVTRDLTAIGSSISLAFSAVQTGAMIIVCAILVTLASPVVAVSGGVFVFLIALIARRNQARMGRASKSASDDEGAFCSFLDHALSGFRELTIGRPKQVDLYDEHLLPRAAGARNSRVELGRLFARQLQFTHGAWFILVGLAAFIAPSMGASVGVTTAVLILAFVRTPMVDMTTYLPSIINARLAIQRLYALEIDLKPNTNEQDASAEDIRRTARFLGQKSSSQPPSSADTSANTSSSLKAPSQADIVSTAGFRSIQTDKLMYQYFDPDGDPVFQVGPIDIEIRAGEVILVSGGNGSGKTTFLKMLTGLYPPQSGRVLIDGKSKSSQNLRDLYSCVFTDFHLFQRLYGIDEFDNQDAGELLTLLDLAHKVFIHDGAFSSIALSSGQRRRLALVAAYLERRPIVLFDEWTADQDPAFRQFFYAELLPQLKAQGKTVIAVTHDLVEVACADRELRFENGLLRDNR